MPEVLLQTSSELGSAANWLAFVTAAVTAAFVLYVGIALWAVLHAADEQQRELRYQIFHDLLDLFRRGNRKQQ
jgi:hypothetical protein